MTVLNDQPQVPSVTDYWPGTGSPSESPYKRSGLTKKDLLKTYDVRITTSKKWRKDEFDGTWKRMVDLYRGKHFSGTSTEDRIMVNVAFSTVNVIVPSIAVNDPFITVGARHPDKEPAAEAAEAMVNYWWRRWAWKNEIKKSVKDSLVISHGWVKVGWHYDQKFRALSEQERAQQAQQLIEQANAYAAEHPEAAPELPSDEDIYASIDEMTQPEVSEDRPYVERVSPFDVLVDPEATCEEDMKWIAQRIVVPLERAKKDKRYSATARAALKADMSTNPRWRDKEQQSDKSDTQSDDIKRVTLWEYWDIEHEFYCLFADGADSFLIEPTDFPYAFGCPFVYLPNYEVPDQFYTVGDLEMLEPMQHELNAVRSDMMNHRKRWQRAYLVRRDRFDLEAQNVLTSDADNRMVFADGDDPLTDAVIPIPQTTLDPQMYQYSDQIEGDVELISGVSEYQRGSAPETRRTATEANLIQSATNARVSDKLAQIETFMAKVATRVVQLAQQYLTGEHLARVIGQDGQQSWAQFDRDTIAGEFDFVVEAGSTQPKDEQYRRQQAMEIMQVLQPFVGAIVDPQALVAFVLKNGFGIKDPSMFIMQQDPNAQQGPHLTEKIIESISYKDVPSDIQRQMEEQAGFQPSQIGGTAIDEQTQVDHESAMAQAEQKHSHAQEQAALQGALSQAQAAQQAQQQGGDSGSGSA